MPDSKGAYHPRSTKIHINYRFSLIIQGGLEIPVEVTVEMDISEENVWCNVNYLLILAMEKHKALF